MANRQIDVETVLAALKKNGTKRTRDGMARYAIVAPKAYGVTVGTIRSLAKRFGRDHRLCEALWQSGWYEARMICAFMDEPEQVTAAQMERWARDFDNWAICDTLCFALFDRTPHAWRKVHAWANRREEFVKRAAFALLASLAVHDKAADAAKFSECLPLIERAAADERNFVKKAVNWSLRTIGKRNPELNASAIDCARRLSQSTDAAPRWVGKDALRELSSVSVQKRLKARKKTRS
jgi:3-methyladenine DNA glycosylase AlkD